MSANYLHGGDELIKKLKDIAKNMQGSLRVGFMEEATYPNETPVAAVAYWNEYGKKNQPPRPFFRTMVEEQLSTWPEKMASWAKKDNYDSKKVFLKLGLDISGRLRKSIIKFVSPPLSEVTLMLRKMKWSNPETITLADVIEAAERVAKGKKGAVGTQAKPLIWTGHMLKSIAYQIK